MKSINPANGELLKEYKEIDLKEANEIISLSHKAWRSWKKAPYSRRATLISKLGNVLKSNKEHYAELITSEMGKVMKESIAEVEKCTKVCEYYAEFGEGLLSNTEISTNAKSSYVSYQPLGVVLGVMPWNFPFWQVFRYAIPTLMAGNTCLLKHASNVSHCALAIESIFDEAGFPADVFRTLLVSSGKVEKIIENRMIKAITVTGSTKAGKAIARKSGELLKKTVMELGGSDPYVILENAELESAVKTCVQSRLLNAGQSCISAKRFIVVESVYDQFLSLFVSEMASKKYGDPTAAEVDIGPMAREDLLDDLHNQVMESIEKGASCLRGGALQKDLKGFYYPPTVLEHVEPGMPAYDEELFGPVAAVICAKDKSEAIRIANDTNFGLGAAVFTKDLEEGREVAELHLEAGCCFVNEMVQSDPRLPFGGIKESGYGRELGPFGIKEFVNAKTVFIK